jgi:hypothetical protein
VRESGEIGSENSRLDCTEKVDHAMEFAPEAARERAAPQDRFGHVHEPVKEVLPNRFGELAHEGPLVGDVWNPETAQKANNVALLTKDHRALRKQARLGRGETSIAVKRSSGANKCCSRPRAMPSGA